MDDSSNRNTLGMTGRGKTDRYTQTQSHTGQSGNRRQHVKVVRERAVLAWKVRLQWQGVRVLLCVEDAAAA